MRRKLLIGLAYGATLGVLAVMAAGAGHGTYVPMGVSSAPAGFFGIAVALGGAPTLWAIVGAVLQRAESKKAVVIILLVHYLTALWLLRSEPYGDWEYFRRALQQVPEVVVTWAVVYCGGQFLLWTSLLRRFGAGTGD